MSTSTGKPDVTVAEFGRLQEVIGADLDTGVREFDVQTLAQRANLTDAKVYTALSHLAQKHDYISDAGEGTWRIETEE
jgi:DNA-binding IclR family transcriptional regulator